MASNGSHGTGKARDDNVEDVIMLELPTDSPFALFSNPNVELFDTTSTPTVTSSKPRFEPKVKPRGSQAKARGSKLAPLPPKPEASKKSDLNPKPNGKEVKPQAFESTEDNGHQALPAELLNGDIMKVKLEDPVSLLPNVKIEAETEVKVESDAKLDVEMEVEPLQAAAVQCPATESGPDNVVREIDVFLSRSVDPSTQFYLLQYPLRPTWRPYGLEEQCLEVRVKAKQSKLELDLAIDTDSENYDEDASENVKIRTQTLSSSKIPLRTSYAIGVLQNNMLHLNPLQAVVQLRPSMKHLDDSDSRKTKQASGSGGDGDEEMGDAEAPESATPELVALQVNVRRRETEWQEANRLHSHAYIKQMDDAEPWIPLEPHGVDSPVTDGVRRKMIASASTQIPFAVSCDDYVNKLVPSQEVDSSVEVLSSDGNGSGGLSRSYLNTLPLEKRFDLLLSKGRVQVLQFERLMKLAPQDSTELEVLNVLRDKAVLVQGCWVVSSSLRYTKPVSTIRNFLLLLFTKSRVVQHSQLDCLQVSKEILREILLAFAIQNGVTASWEFLENTDRSFIKRHQAVVREQAQRWTEMEASLAEAVKHLEVITTKGVGSPKIDLSTVKDVSDIKQLHAGSPAKASSVSQGAKVVHFNIVADVDGDFGKVSPLKTIVGRGSLSEATMAALPRALNKIFLKHNVCRLQFICQTLRQMAIVAVGGSSKAPTHNLAVEEAKAAAQAAAAPLPELEAAVSTVASNIDGVYFLSSLGIPSLDPFRNVVIALLRAKGPGSGLRKTDIMEASKIALKTEVPQMTYQKVLKELCYTKGGAWVLKPGDGRPS